MSKKPQSLLAPIISQKKERVGAILKLQCIGNWNYICHTIGSKSFIPILDFFPGKIYFLLE